jgi:hypothetical protein
MTGKGIVQRICKEDGKPFTTSLPTEIHPTPENQKLEPEPASLAEEIFANRG